MLEKDPEGRLKGLSGQVGKGAGKIRKDETVRVEELAVKPQSPLPPVILSSVPVFVISYNGVPCPCQVSPDLVGASGHKVDFQQCGVLYRRLAGIRSQ